MDQECILLLKEFRNGTHISMFPWSVGKNGLSPSPLDAEPQAPAEPSQYPNYLTSVLSSQLSSRDIATQCRCLSLLLPPPRTPTCARIAVLAVPHCYFCLPKQALQHLSTGVSQRVAVCEEVG